MTNPNHTDISRSGDLVANMRDTIREWERDEPRDDWFLHQHDFAEAADRIEALEAEVERLRGALREYVYETTHLSPQEEDGSHWCKISANCLNNARAALGEKQ